MREEDMETNEFVEMDRLMAEERRQRREERRQRREERRQRRESDGRAAFYRRQLEELEQRMGR
jgi:hypothetical protein